MRVMDGGLWHQLHDLIEWRVLDGFQLLVVTANLDSMVSLNHLLAKLVKFLIGDKTFIRELDIGVDVIH